MLEANGTAHLYDGVIKAGGLLRARAVCGRRPAMMILAGDGDNGSTHPIEEAAIAAYGVQGDPTEAIFSYGIAFDDAASTDLKTIIIDDSVGTVDNISAGGSDAISLAINSARDAIDGLVPH